MTVSEEEFWGAYRDLEEVAKLPLEEFLADDLAFNRALGDIRGCLKAVERKARKVATANGLESQGGIIELCWGLAQAHVISPKLLEDLEDVYKIAFYEKDRVTVYSALIRCMEVLEALRTSFTSSQH